MHKTKESGAIAGGSPGVQELREGTLYCHLRCFVDKFIQKRAVLCVVQGFPASPKQGEGQNWKTDSWALILPAHKCSQMLFIGGQIIWEGKDRLPRTPKRSSSFKNVVFGGGCSKTLWGLFLPISRKFLFKMWKYLGFKPILANKRVLFSTLKFFKVLND